MRKIFSITMIKNEVDIIETFVRYHLSFLDSMVILDNGSTDGTIEILLKLIDEGLPIHLTFNDNPAYNQSELTTKLFYKTLKKFNPAYIIPLDADEFITTNSNKSIREIIQKDIKDNAINYISWVTYVPTEKDDQSEKNILKRLRYRRQEQHNYDEKIIIPTSIAKKNKIKIKQGNHDLYKVKNVTFKKNTLSSLDLAHFPIRSIKQMKSKYLIGWLANLARPKQVLFDWF
ncbi:MAG TPA: glycosyltransferase family 2 protein, partial [Ignavibacteria bacterium]|nr:glycosyltransferase family 2 protein [Ignavibacteria bacterium]